MKKEHHPFLIDVAVGKTTFALRVSQTQEPLRLPVYSNAEVNVLFNDTRPVKVGIWDTEM